MLLDSQFFAPKVEYFTWRIIGCSGSPEVVHVPHLSVEHWEESEKQIKPDDIREVKSKVPLVWK